MTRYIIVGIVVIVLVWFFVFRQKELTGEITTNKVANTVYKRWRKDVEAASKYYGVPTDIIYAVICVESAGEVDPPRGKAGEVGLMQITPIGFAEVARNGYAGGLTLTTLADDAKLGDGRANIFCGTALLKIYKVRGGTWTEAIRLYNPGKSDQVPRVNFFRQFFQ